MTGRKVIKKGNSVARMRTQLWGSRSWVSGMNLCSSGPSHRMGMLDWASLEHPNVQHRVLTTWTPFHDLNVASIFLHFHIFIFFKVLSTELGSGTNTTNPACLISSAAPADFRGIVCSAGCLLDAWVIPGEMRCRYRECCFQKFLIFGAQVRKTQRPLLP